MALFKLNTEETLQGANTPYSSPRYGWRYINYVHLLSKQPMGLFIKPSTAGAKVTTLRQKISGGRHFVCTSPVPEAEELAPLRTCTSLTRVGITPMTVTITQREGFIQAYSVMAVREFPYVRLLFEVDDFVRNGMGSKHLHSPPLCLAAQEALQLYVTIAGRGTLKNFQVGETFVALTR